MFHQPDIILNLEMLYEKHFQLLNSRFSISALVDPAVLPNMLSIPKRTDKTLTEPTHIILKYQSFYKPFYGPL